MWMVYFIGAHVDTEIPDVVSEKLSDGILICAIHSHVKPLHILSNFQLS